MMGKKANLYNGSMGMKQTSSKTKLCGGMCFFLSSKTDGNSVFKGMRLLNSEGGQRLTGRRWDNEDSHHLLPNGVNKSYSLIFHKYASQKKGNPV